MEEKAKTEYCEMWLEMQGVTKTFRVALLVPEGLDTPPDFEFLDAQLESPKRFFVSAWLSGIAKAKEVLNSTERFYNDMGVKFLSFREIRRPTM